MIFNLSKINFKKNQFVSSHFKIHPMILTIDVGNTRIKTAVFEENTLLEVGVFEKNELQKNIENILKKYPNITNLVVASVGNVAESEFLVWENQLKIQFISHKTQFPFQNLYKTPLTLGIDRMVLASGAVLEFPKKNRLVIDAGTCITYDFVDENDNYLGGGIAPGLQLRYGALHHFTAKLPLLSLSDLKKEADLITEPKLIGNSTQQSIHSGVINGLINEINGFISQYESQYLNFIIILTGGDTDFLAVRLKNTIFANRNFLLESLNQIYQYNNKND